jgi:hypothetical protein
LNASSMYDQCEIKGIPSTFCETSSCCCCKIEEEEDDDPADKEDRTPVHKLEKEIGVACENESIEL